MSKPLSNILLRWITALVVLPVVLTLIWIPALSLGFSILVVIVVAVAVHEVYNLARALHLQPQVLPGIAGAIAIAVSAHFGELFYLNIALLAAIILVGSAHVLATPPSMAGINASIVGLVYAAWCPSHVLLLHAPKPTGRGLVMLLIIIVVLTDTAAYFVGKSIGRHKLAPVVSPKKTWEGAIGGFLCATLAMLVVFWLKERFGWVSYPEWSPPRYLITGAVVSVVAQISDLVKSSFKRDAGVKDAGSLFPGHGGALDRFDGFLFGAPVIYYMAVF